MKKSVAVLFILSFLLSTIGMIADGDPKETSMMLRFTEFFAMTTFIFLVISAIYFSSKFIFNKFKTE